ncbi:MAG: response regulator [Candidatus Eremiobacteraeota bacterium]|nr:response regulator [Candidatus Eremiobacteraeota bacterium]
MMRKKPVRILVAEDEAIIALGIKCELEQAGYEVCALVASGEKAVASVAQKQPDLVLMDANLAGKTDGIEAARIITSEYSVPVIFMTGYSDRDRMERAKDLDPLGYFMKPVDVAIMKQLIDSARIIIELGDGVTENEDLIAFLLTSLPFPARE